MNDTITGNQQFPCALAMAYVRFQSLGSNYTPEEALCRGTLFPDLDKPWLVGRRVNF